MIRRLAAGAAAALVLTGIPATGAVAGTTGTGPALPVKVMHITTHGVTATVTIRGDWHLANVKIPSTRLPHVKVRNTQAFSDNWGGWVDTGHNVAFRFVSANFTAPNVNCANSTAGSSGVDDAAGWTGLDGFNSSTVEQNGFAEVCTPGQTPEQSDFAWYEVYPNAAVAFTGVQPGDALASSDFFNSSTGEYNLVLNDLTQNGAGFNVEVGCGTTTCANSSAEIISEVSNGGPPAGYNLADFGAMEFTNAAVTARDGMRGNLGANKLWSPTNIDTVGATDTMQTAGPLQGNTAFLETWKASS